MTLYSASLMDIAKPVEKKGKKEKVAKEKVSEETVEKPELSEKRKAALEKAQETRKRKREEAAALKIAENEAIAAKEAEIKAKEEEIARKKEEAKEKRRLKKAQKVEKQEQTPPSSETSEVSEELKESIEPPVKKQKKVKVPRDDSIPPTWFQKYVEGVKQEEARQSQAKVSKKQVEIEAKSAATKQWQDGLTRDRIQNEVDGHMSRMYGMIFHNRKMK